ncbi:MAG TPA: glycosyltransferase family 4 protein, partial [Gammaproteobacteria bacterium]|nr:glycosyltransferase family 4 protein [Gammaproteobacteria bacterium]
ATGILQKEDLLQAYRDCDALLFPSRLEGFGYSVCEAMACGRPVITSDNSSLSEIVKNGETGLLCRTDNVESFCNAVKTLAEKPEIAAGMGRSARQHVLDHFTLEKMIDNYIAIYNDLLNS